LAGSSNAVELFPGNLAAEPAWAFWVSPDESRVVISAGGLYGVPLWGTANEVVRLDEGDAEGPGRVVYPHFFTPDSLRFVFGKSAEPTGIRANALFAVPVVGPGSAAVQVSPPDATEVTWARASEDSSRICLRTLAAPGERGEVFVSPITGPAGAAVRLSVPLFGPTGAGACEFTGDSSTVVYSGHMDNFGDRAVLAVPVEGPPESAIRLTLPLNPMGGALAWRLDTLGSTLLYSGQYGGDGAMRLQVVPVAGPASASVPMGAPFYDPTGTWAGTVIAPNGRSVLLFADFEDAGQYELLALDLEHPEEPGTFLNPPLVPGGSLIYDFAWLPDSLGAVYRGDAEIDEKFELYVADALVFADGFESGDASRWLPSTDG
ncbi:MAG: hypothetical protein KC729_16490, partial [Candidatus Eisenbacteria bacterium]|nr:hypothetical protein [Candidatus Eisenbacteria bacterium]